ncbi:MAG: hypothetical protein S0880_23090, partial [Actinomycetota bacterium]|nr:hypothetical protein [Actinomycetota bacterium]
MRTLRLRSRAGSGQRRLGPGTSVHALRGAALVLGAAALVEASVEIAPDGSTVQYRVALVCVALAATVPVALARPAVAAAVVCGAGVLS